MLAVILAGGLGDRLRPFTQAIPKPLLPIGEQSLLEVQVTNLAKSGATRIFIATNYKSEYIENFIGNGDQYGVEILYSRETKRLGTCGPLSLLREKLDEPFLTMNGDILTTMDFAKFYEFGCSMPGDFTIATKNIVTPFNFGKVHTDGDRIIKVEEKPDVYTEVLAGIYFMRPAVLPMIPYDTFFGIPDLIEKMLQEGLPIMRYAMQEYWIDIGRIEDYTAAQEAYKTHFSEA